MRKNIVAGNWKMNLGLSEAESLLNEINQGARNIGAVELVVAPPYPFLNIMANAPSIKSCAQNCSNKSNGAFTGEVSSEMLNSMSIDYCIIGHSERRQYFNESNEVIAEKFTKLVDSSITPILCVGESLDERNNNRHVEVVANQINAVLTSGANKQANFVVAYEPIWAIGTGETASPEQAQDMHQQIRATLASIIGDRSSQTSILYGGSCKPENAKELFSQPDIDGGLIGGASLKSDSFLQIAKSF